MAGRFDGLSDAEWSLFGNIFPACEKRGRGMPPVPPRRILNSLLYILITGCRWCDLPRGPQWASRSSSHRRLQSWRIDGTLNKLRAVILGLAENEGLIHWKSGAVDGSFSPGKGGGAEVAHGYKGKGILIHLLVDCEGMPLSAVTTAANEDERKQVGPLLEKIEVKTGRPGRPPKKPKRIAGDKGYDSQELRELLKRKGIRPQIPRKRNAKKKRGRPVGMNAPRFQVERTFSWLQRKFRRLVVRWERLPYCFNSFLSLGIIFMWVQRLPG